MLAREAVRVRLVNGVQQCLICREWRSDWVQLGQWSGGLAYACEAHRAEGRVQLGNLRRSDSALANARRKRRRK